MQAKADLELQALQKIWYAKLEDEGFEEIEDVNSPKEYLKRWHSVYFHFRHTPEAFEEKQEYYRLCSHFLHDHQFNSELERELWAMHTDGMSLRDCSEELKSRGLSFNKDRINKIIQNLTREMRSFRWPDED